METDGLTPELRTRVDATLERDERLVLLAMPDWWWASPGVRFFILFDAFWLLFISIATLSMYHDPETSVQEYLFLSPFWVVGIGILVGILIARAKGKRTAYLITDRRAIVLRNKALFWPLKPDMVKAVNEHKNGYGDIVLGYKSYQVNNEPAPDGFVGVPQVREVLAALQAQIKATCAVEPRPVKWSNEETAPEPKKYKIGCVGMFFAVWGGLFFAVGLYIFLQHHQLEQEGVWAEAVVVKIVIDHDAEDGDSYFPVVQFTDAAGKSRTVQSTWSNKRISKGDKVNVLYRPGNPQHLEIEGENKAFMAYIFMGIGGGVWVMIAWFCIRAWRRGKHKTTA